MTSSLFARLTPIVSRPRSVSFPFVFSALTLGAFAQAPAPAVSPTAPAKPGETIIMSPFEVSSPQDQGYRAGAAITGTGTAGLIKDTPLNISIVSQELIRDQAGNQLIDTIEVDGKSGLTPGMAETMGAGGLAGHLLVSTVVSSGMHVASESQGTDVVADADRAAKGIAKQLAVVLTQQGWTTH